MKLFQNQQHTRGHFVLKCMAMCFIFTKYYADCIVNRICFVPFKNQLEILRLQKMYTVFDFATMRYM